MLAFVLDVLHRAAMMLLAGYLWALAAVLLWSAVDDVRAGEDRPSLLERPCCLGLIVFGRRRCQGHER